MSEGTAKAIAEAVKAASEPVTKLIESVSKGVGKLYEPTGIIRKAEAEAKASLILAQADADRRELSLRAGQRIAFLETRRQEVIESITQKAIAYLPENVSKDPVSEDWMVQFFENSKDVTEPELQRLWAAILAGEVSKPGGYSRRTLALLKTFDKEDAEIFTRYCSTAFSYEDQPFRFSFDASVRDKSLSMPFDPLDIENHLVSLGLLAANSGTMGVSGYAGWTVDYFGKIYRISAPEKPPPIGEIEGIEQVITMRSFTLVGNQIASVVQPIEIPGFVEKLSEEFSVLGVKFHEIKDAGNGEISK